MQAVILAGGFGTRIQPLTTSLPKPMLPILNRPMMEHIVHKLRKLDITDIVVLLYFKPDVIRDYFKDGSDFGVSIRYVLPDDDYGTAGAVRLAKDFLHETFIIISADLVSDFDLGAMIEYHYAKASELTITLTSVEDPLQFGVVIADEEGKITKFLEKPSWGEVFSDTINTGIYILEPHILDAIGYEENFDFAKDLFPLLMKRGVTLWGYTAQGYWRDVGNPQSYREVYHDIWDHRIAIEWDGYVTQLDEGRLYHHDEHPRLGKNVRIKGDVYLGHNVTIEEDVLLHECVLGENVAVESKAKVIRTVAWDEVVIESKAVVENCIICDNTSIGKKAKIKNGAIIAEGCEIQKGVVFEKDVTVWPDKVVEEFSIVNQNIVWGDKYKNSLFDNGAVFGITNIELSCQMAVKLAEAFGSHCSVHDTIYVARDYHKSSRMLKRSFLGGLLSSGINVIDLKEQSANVLRYNLQNNPNVRYGIQIRKSERGESGTEILFFDEQGVRIDTNGAKSIERLFFRESFRRVGVRDIGEIIENVQLTEPYLTHLISNIDTDFFKTKEMKIAIDLTFGLTGDLFSKIFNRLGVESIVLNAYQNEQKLARALSVAKSSIYDLSLIVKNLGLYAGFVIYPNGQRVDLVCDQGHVFSQLQSLIAMLSLLNNEGKPLNVLLPSYAPDFFDREFHNLTITRRAFANLKAKTLQEFDFIAGLNGDFTFTDFSLTPDAVYSSIKMLEMLSRQGKQLSELFVELHGCHFESRIIPCESRHKGKLMRKFLKFASDKKFSHDDGVKIWTSRHEWVHMIPSQYDETILLYVQSATQESAQALEEEFEERIKGWISE